MKLKKTAIILLSFVLVVSCAIAFTACNKQVNVRFVIDDRSTTVTVTAGETVTPPQSNAPIGFKEVWYKDKNHTEKWNFDDAVKEDLILYGQNEVTEITIAQALELCADENYNSTDRYLIRATVKSIDNPNYGQMTITDDTGEISVYGTYGADGQARYSELEEKPYAGYEVLLSCLLQNFNGKREVKSGWILEFKKLDTSDNFNEADYAVMTVDAARKANDETKVKVNGVVAGITYASGQKPSGFYLIDNTASIYVYDSQIAPQVEIGNTVTICGVKTHFILDTEKANAEKFGYKGCNQITNVHMTENDKGKADFNKTWITEKTVKEIIDTPVTEDVAALTYKTTALIKRVQNEGQNFINYYIDDLDGKTGSYVYTQCDGKDFAWLDAFDGKICTVYLSPLNAKATASGCSWRFIPLLVVDEGFTFDLSKTPEFAVTYYGIPQFQSEYMFTAEAELPNALTTNVSSDILKFENATLAYESDNTAVIDFVTENNVTKAVIKGIGKANVTIRGSYSTYASCEKKIEINVKEAPKIDSVTVAEAIASELDKEVTVKGIVGPSLVNKVGFYLIDDSGVIAVTTDKDTMATLTIGDEVILKGNRTKKWNEKTFEHFGQTTISDCVVLVNNHGNHEYSEQTFVKDKTIADLKELSVAEDHTATVYVVDVFVNVVNKGNNSSVIQLKASNADDAQYLELYCSGIAQYAWLNEFDQKTVKMELALCNWNDKQFYKSCVLAVYNEDGTKTPNTLNFTNK